MRGESSLISTPGPESRLIAVCLSIRGNFVQRDLQGRHSPENSPSSPLGSNSLPPNLSLRPASRYLISPHHTKQSRYSFHQPYLPNPRNPEYGVISASSRYPSTCQSTDQSAPVAHRAKLRVESTKALRRLRICIEHTPNSVHVREAWWRRLR